jgi:hypothetical protein
VLHINSFLNIYLQIYSLYWVPFHSASNVLSCRKIINFHEIQFISSFVACFGTVSKESLADPMS